MAPACACVKQERSFDWQMSGSLSGEVGYAGCVMIEDRSTRSSGTEEVALKGVLTHTEATAYKKCKNCQELSLCCFACVDGGYERSPRHRHFLECGGPCVFVLFLRRAVRDLSWIEVSIWPDAIDGIVFATRTCARLAISVLAFSGGQHECQAASQVSRGAPGVSSSARLDSLVSRRIARDRTGRTGSVEDDVVGRVIQIR